MFAVALCQQKGGVGKTTLAVHLAAAFAAKGRRVLLLDADPQGSAMDWSAVRGESSPPFAVLGLARPVLHRELPTVAAGYDVAVIDAPPRGDEVSRSAIAAANVVLLPVAPSPLDVWAARETVVLVREAESFAPHLAAAFVLNRRAMNTALGRDVGAALAGYGLPILRSSVGQRIAFADAMATGRTVLETDPKGKGSTEIRALAAEVWKMKGKDP